MATRTATAVRADVVGSLLRPEYLREARAAALAGTIDAVSCVRRRTARCSRRSHSRRAPGSRRSRTGSTGGHGWIALIPIIDDPLFRPPVSGFEFLDADSGWRNLWKTGSGEPADTSGLPPEEPFVTRRLQVDRDIVTDEFAFLKANAHARAKYTIPAPSWHRIYWHPEYSSDAYPTSRRLHRRRRADPPRARRRPAGRARLRLHPDRRAELRRSGTSTRRTVPRSRRTGTTWRTSSSRTPSSTAWSSRASTGVTRAMHMCRGNAPGGMWAASGGYEAISKEVFPLLQNLDRLLLEYDSDRAGTFEPLADVLPQPPGRARARDDEGRHARGSGRPRRARRGGRRGTCRSSGWRSARSAGSPRGVIGAMTAERAGGEAAARRRRRPARLGVGVSGLVAPDDERLVVAAEHASRRDGAARRSRRPGRDPMTGSSGGARRPPGCGSARQDLPDLERSIHARAPRYDVSRCRTRPMTRPRGLRRAGLFARLTQRR